MDKKRRRSIALAKEKYIYICNKHAQFCFWQVHQTSNYAVHLDESNGNSTKGQSKGTSNLDTSTIVDTGRVGSLASG
jgi:hypothetical protein